MRPWILFVCKNDWCPLSPIGIGHHPHCLWESTRYSWHCLGGVESTPGPEPPKASRRRLVKTAFVRANCSPICCEPLEESSISETCFCKLGCGSNMHKVCFSKWVESRQKQGLVVTCGISAEYIFLMWVAMCREEMETWWDFVIISNASKDVELCITCTFDL